MFGQTGVIHNSTANIQGSKVIHALSGQGFVGGKRGPKTLAGGYNVNYDLWISITLFYSQNPTDAL